MNKLQKFFLDLKNKNFKEGETAVRENVSYSNAKTAGILFNSYTLENPDSLSNFIKQLQQDNIIVKALTFIDSTNKNPVPVLNFNHHVITEKDISIFGQINSILVEDFIKTDFDYLFCISVKPFDIFEHILLRSKAKCRIGKHMSEERHFELMIKLNENEGTDALIQQMYYYVKTIKND